MKKIYSVCIFMVLPFLIACNENHSFSLDESRQLLIVHNFLHMEIESDCLDPSERGGVICSSLQRKMNLTLGVVTQ